MSGKAVIVAPFKADTDKFELMMNEYAYPDKDSLKFLQKAVGGWIEHFQFCSELENAYIDSYINEEGKMLDLEPTFILADQEGKIVDVVAGPVVFNAYDDEGNNFGMNDTQTEILYKWLESLPIATMGSRDSAKLNRCYYVEMPYRIKDYM